MEHHDAALAGFVDRWRVEPTCLAVIVTGSLARGTERPDSDVDLYVLVTEEHWNDAFARNRLMFTEDEGIGYPGGYFDIKLTTLSYLSDAAERGDDPVRDSFAASRIVFSRVDDLAERIDRIGASSDDDWTARAASFIAQARLHGGYFLKQAAESGDPLLLHHAAVHMATSVSRALLALNRVRFPGPKYLSKLVSELGNKPEGIDALIVAVVEDPTSASADALLAALEAFAGDILPRDQTLSTFVLDNELAWRYRTKTPEYS
jgi:hypothetical protein